MTPFFANQKRNFSHGRNPQGDGTTWACSRFAASSAAVTMF
jgi:hypothetical protein